MGILREFCEDFARISWRITRISRVNPRFSPRMSKIAPSLCPRMSRIAPRLSPRMSRSSPKIRPEMSFMTYIY